MRIALVRFVHPTDTPVSGGLLLGKIHEEAGLPAGVLNVLIAKADLHGDRPVHRGRPAARRVRPRGRYNGRWSIEEFTTVHWISVQHEPAPYPF